MIPRHVEGFSTAGEVLADLCRCESPACPLPHDPWREVSYPPDDVLCECLDPLCRLAHTQEATALFIMGKAGYRLWSLRHRGLPGALPMVPSFDPPGQLVTGGATGEPAVSGGRQPDRGERQTGRPQP